MTSQEMLRADLLDILFEHRNKSYGAYELRRFYPARLRTALISSVFVIALMLFFFSPKYEKNLTPVFQQPDSGILVRTVTIPPQTPPPPAPRNIQRTAAAAQIRHLPLRIVENPDITDIPEQSAMEDRVIAGGRSDGGPAALPVPPVAVAEEKPVPAAPSPFVPSYSAPEFPGGLAAWMHFLNRNLRVPESLGPGEKKSVIVRFLVGTDGAVSGFDVVQSAGTEFDREVIRVLKKMPKWKPAVQNGHPTALPFTQPVTFIGLEE